MMAKMKTYSCLNVLTLLLCVTNCRGFSEAVQDVSIAPETLSASVSTIRNNDNVIINSALNDDGHGEKSWRRRHYARRRSRNNAKFMENRDGGSWSSWTRNNFIMTDSLPDGERQIRIHVNGTFAKQTSAIENGEGLILRQISDGHQFIQMIYSAENELLDCEYVEKKTSVKKFIKTFRKEITNYNAAYKKRRQHNNDDCRSLSYTAMWKCKKNKRVRKPKPIKEFDDDYDNPELIIDSIDEIKRQMKRDADDDSEWMEKEPLRPKHYEKKRRNDKLESLKNVTVRILNDESSPGQDMADWVDIEKSKKQCELIHEKLYRKYDRDSETANKRFRRSEESLVIVPGTLWCGVGNLANSFTELGPMSSTDACCRMHDHCPIRVGGLEHSKGLLNTKPYTVSYCSCDRRKSRVVRSTVLFPGTRWCGRGSSGSHNELGEFGAADRCCRLHDSACPFWVDAMKKKYGIFNYRPSTLMHCRCDERFRTCLKMANTDVSNMVGRIFFNIVQTKCFVLKPVKVCKERSWWGKCLKKGSMKQAHLRDNLPY